MQTLFALVAVVAACVLARPPAPSLPAAPPAPHAPPAPGAGGGLARQGPASSDDYPVPHFAAPELSYDESQEPSLEDLYREIGYINRLADGIDGRRFGLNRLLPAQRSPLTPYMLLPEPREYNYLRLSPVDAKRAGALTRGFAYPRHDAPRLPDSTNVQTALITTELVPQTSFSDAQKVFLTPFEAGYFDKKYVTRPSTAIENVVHISMARQIRQNPNLSRTKALVAANLEKSRIGQSDDPSTGDGTATPAHIHIYDTGVVTSDPAESIYGVALVAAVGTALALAIVGFGLGWYTLSKRAKAAADVDYPAYGVTGPTADLTGDRKLAHSAHMYHYQHQKQQILAMERNCVDQRNGSVSDPESEEENEEGDYTVYECPGFATTGDMEVKNPMFSDDKTPATPGKCEVVKPQLKK